MTFRTLDAHVGGQALRLVVDGFPSLPGSDMFAKLDWASEHADHLRRALMLEPRGHPDMTGAVLTEPVSADSHAGIVFMDGGGFRGVSGHGIIGATAIALEHRLLTTSASDASGGAILYDTAAGQVMVRATRNEDGTRGSVSFVNVPSFVLHAGLPLTLGKRQILTDVAFGGALYAVVDCEAAGLGIGVRHVPELRRVSAEIIQAIEAKRVIEHPLEPRLRGLEGTVFTGPAGDGAHLRQVVVLASGSVNRSPSGTATSAVMAVLDAMGLLDDDNWFIAEGLSGMRFRARVTARTMVADYPAVVPQIEASVWMTGEHTFIVEAGDPAVTAADSLDL